MRKLCLWGIILVLSVILLIVNITKNQAMESMLYGLTTAIYLYMIIDSLIIYLKNKRKH